MNSPADDRSASHPSTALEGWARCAPVTNKETCITESVIRDARASRRANRIAIGLSAPPKNTRIRLNLASLSPMDASSPTCSAAVGRGESPRLPRGRLASKLERTPTAKRSFLWLLRTGVLSKVVGCRVYGSIWAKAVAQRRWGELQTPVLGRPSWPTALRRLSRRLRLRHRAHRCAAPSPIRAAAPHACCRIGSGHPSASPALGDGTGAGPWRWHAAPLPARRSAAPPKQASAQCLTVRPSQPPCRQAWRLRRAGEGEEQPHRHLTRPPASRCSIQSLAVSALVRTTCPSHMLCREPSRGGQRSRGAACQHRGTKRLASQAPPRSQPAPPPRR